MPAAAADHGPVADRRALAHVGLVADRSRPRRSRAPANTIAPAQTTAPRAEHERLRARRAARGVRRQPRRLAEHRVVLDPHPSPITVPAWITTPAPSSTSSRSSTSAEHQPTHGRTDARSASPGVPPDSSRCTAPPASSDRWSASSTRTTRSPLARPERGLAPSRTHSDEVLALDPQRLLVRDPRAHDVARARDVLAVGADVARRSPCRRRSPCARAPCRRRSPSAATPTTVKRRSLCGSSQDRCRCATSPEGKRR